jgi:LPS-assembly protein
MPSQNLPRRLLCIAMLAAIGHQPAFAAKLGTKSPTRPPLSCTGTPALPMPESSLTPEETSDERVHVYADRIESTLNETTRFSGNVEFGRGGLRLFADEAIYNQTDNSLDASGHIYLHKESGEAVVSPQLRYQIDTQSGVAEDAQFELAGNTARGSAKSIHFEGRDVLTLESLRYTPCPPGQDDWFLKAADLTLDKASETGTAHNAVIEFMQVPIFYSPYLSFPLSDARKSGVLAPRIGQTTNTGFFVAVPYYFDIAPNYDDTLTARAMSKRGLQAVNEFRYLGSSYSGKLDLEFLPNDRETNTDREAVYFRHSQGLSPLWNTSADIAWVSDQTYLTDLGTGPTQSSITALPSNLRLDYGGRIWRFTGRLSTYENLDTTITQSSDLPYQRLPQLLLSGESPGGANQPHYALASEWVYFYRPGDVTPGQQGNAQRFDLLPSISLPLRTEYLYFTPDLGYRFTTWNLNYSADDTSPQRGIPIFNIDSGLAFERASNLFGSAYTVTLEPRIYYVYIPYQNQDSLPTFDSAVPVFDFYNFFRANRFVGADRVGDANQATFAVTSRFLLPGNGSEQARVSLGQIQYFEDQRVNLPPGTVTQTTSDSIGEVYARLGQLWYLRSGLQWDNKQHETRNSTFYLHYRPAPDRIVNFGWRYNNSTSATTNGLNEQFDISTQWPLSTRWTGVARWNYSLPDSTTIQAYAGFQYTSCCWAVRAAARHYINQDGSVNNGVLFEFELTGLAKMGEAPETPLKQGQFIFE